MTKIRSTSLRVFYATSAWSAAIACASMLTGQAVLAQPPRSGDRPPRPKQLFERFDENEDGQLTADEVPEPAWDGLLSRADADEDGNVSRDELRESMSRLRGAVRDRPRGPADLAQRFDENEDGLLTSDEVPDAVWARLTRLDTNDDGEIDSEELTQIAQRRRAMGRPGDRDNMRRRPPRGTERAAGAREGRDEPKADDADADERSAADDDDDSAHARAEKPRRRDHGPRAQRRGQRGPRGPRFAERGRRPRHPRRFSDYRGPGDRQMRRFAAGGRRGADWAPRGGRGYYGRMAWRDHRGGDFRPDFRRVERGFDGRRWADRGRGFGGPPRSLGRDRGLRFARRDWAPRGRQGGPPRFDRGQGGGALGRYEVVERRLDRWEALIARQERLQERWNDLREQGDSWPEMRRELPDRDADSGPPRRGFRGPGQRDRSGQTPRAGRPDRPQRPNRPDRPSRSPSQESSADVQQSADALPAVTESVAVNESPAP